MVERKSFREERLPKNGARIIRSCEYSTFHHVHGAETIMVEEPDKGRKVRWTIRVRELGAGTIYRVDRNVTLLTTFKRGRSTVCVFIEKMSVDSELDEDKETSLSSP